MIAGTIPGSVVSFPYYRKLQRAVSEILPSSPDEQQMPLQHHPAGYFPNRRNPEQGG